MLPTVKKTSYKYFLLSRLFEFKRRIKRCSDSYQRLLLEEKYSQYKLLLEQL